MSFQLMNLVRNNIKQMKPYSSARSEFCGDAKVFLDANENGFGSPFDQDFSRYPDPMQIELKTALSGFLPINQSEIFVGNGSDEAIDLLFRVFCEPKLDNAVICPPTYGMYEVSAAINNVEVKKVNLSADFEIDFDAVKRLINRNTKLIFICSPNNPTGNSVERNALLNFARTFDGIVVVDEAYIHFSDNISLVNEVQIIPNLVVLQTFSKAWGLAGLRVGLAIAHEEIIELFNLVKPPYNVSKIAQEAVLDALENKETFLKNVGKIVAERQRLANDLAKLKIVAKIYPSDANFLLVKTISPNAIYKFLLDHNIVVRNRNNVELCEGCLRITVGTSDENELLIKTLHKIEIRLMEENGNL